MRGRNRLRLKPLLEVGLAGASVVVAWGLLRLRDLERTRVRLGLNLDLERLLVSESCRTVLTWAGVDDDCDLVFD